MKKQFFNLWRILYLISHFLRKMYYAYFVQEGRPFPESIACNHRLNVELDLQSLFRLHVHRCTHYSLAETPQLPRPHLAFELIYEGPIGQPR
jgi:hypothetical protein